MRFVCRLQQSGLCTSLSYGRGLPRPTRSILRLNRRHTTPACPVGTRFIASQGGGGAFQSREQHKIVDSGYILGEQYHVYCNKTINTTTATCSAAHLESANFQGLVALAAALHTLLCWHLRLVPLCHQNPALSRTVQ